MEIIRKNFRFNRRINLQEILSNSSLFFMGQEDIDIDNVINEENLEEEESFIVFQNTSEQYINERYCYLKLNTLIGRDHNTKQISVEKIIIDTNLISIEFFKSIFIILLQQEDNEFPNRIVVSNINERFRGRIDEVANIIGERLYFLYANYTSIESPEYHIQ